MSGGQTPAYVRTGTPIGAGAVIVFIAKQLGVDLTVDQALLLMPAVMYAYYVLGRLLESFDPRLGYILGIAKTPAYSIEPSTSPDRGEKLAGVVVPEGTDPQAVQDAVDNSSLSPAVDEPVDVEVHDRAVPDPDLNIALLAGHASPSPIDPPPRPPSKRAEAVSQRLKSTPLAEVRAEAAKKAPAKRAPRKKPAPPE